MWPSWSPGRDDHGAPMVNRGTGVGSMPGLDFADSMQVILGEVGDLPYLAELPARGPHASMIGRTMAMVTELGADLQPAGWRLTDAPGIDHRRATSLLAQDLDTVEELADGIGASFKVQVTGPWTLAASVERPRGDKVLADHGARRDLAQALAEGVRDHVADVRRRVAASQLWVQIDEPALPAVLTGSIPTASGFSRHRSVANADAAQAIGWLTEAIGSAGATPLLHCCAQTIPFDLLQQTAVRALSVDLEMLGVDTFDSVGEWIDAGREIWLGVVPGSDLPSSVSATPAQLTKRLLTWWSGLGYSDVEALPAQTVTPSCGLAGASPGWARRAHEIVAEVARNLSEEQGKIAL